MKKLLVIGLLMGSALTAEAQLLSGPPISARQLYDGTLKLIIDVDAKKIYRDDGATVFMDWHGTTTDINGEIHTNGYAIDLGDGNLLGGAGYVQGFELKVGLFGVAVGTISPSGLSADRTFQLPDANGTLALRNGTTTSDSAAAGEIGQYIESRVASGSAVSLTSATAANVTSISLTAGDWDVVANINIAGATATYTQGVGGISSTSATLPTDGSEVNSGAQFTLLTVTDGVTLPRKRVSISSTTTIYLVAKATFSAGTMTAYGQINGRRVR